MFPQIVKFMGVIVLEKKVFIYAVVLIVTAILTSVLYALRPLSAKV